MALREKLTERAQPFLEPDEKVQQIFMTQTGPSPWLGVLVGALILLAMVKRRVVVVTDRAIVVIEVGAWSGTKPKRVLARLPRATKIGPVTGLWAKITLGEEKMWVHKRFHKDVEAADA